MPRIDSTLVLFKEDIDKIKNGHELYVEFGPGMIIPIAYEKRRGEFKEGVEKIPCPCCEKPCKSNFGLSRHLNSKHKSDPKAIKWLKDYKGGK